MTIISPHHEMIRVGAMREYRASGNRATARIRFCDRGRHAVSSLKKQQTRTETNRRGKSIPTGTTGDRTILIPSHIHIITGAPHTTRITGVELTTAIIATIITTAIELI
jgi:hypothetical protein